ncbi:MAG TPA: S8 family serine peptidase [Chitinophagaceae bacterium]
MKRCLLLLIVSSLVVVEANAQFTRYIVKFKNKAGTPYTFTNPSAYLSARAIDRRTRYNIAIDSTDLPVTPSYLNQLSSVPNVTVLNVSKWLNQVSIQTSDANAITTINNFSFVQSVTGIAARIAGNDRQTTPGKFEPEDLTTVVPAQRTTATTDYYNYGTNSYNEIKLHNGEFLHNVGLRGQGMQVAILDAGFFSYNTLRAFDSINLNGQVLGTWDFVSRHASVSEDHSHGMQCLSTIAANIPGQFVGKAPKASFYLYRTEESATEYPIEEHNWVCGAERADSVGVDIISSSLGYYDFDNAAFNYSYADMNGRTTIAARGATIGARKGLLIFNAVGNEGTIAWHYLITPSDADSVAAVGAVSAAGFVGNFSSYGPSSDGQIKPDMASVGVSAVVQNTNNTIGTNNGTSFACPNMAGLTTCLWQGFPEFNSIKIIRTLQQAGNRYSTPDDRTGYGIPNLKLAFTNLLTEFATSSASFNSCAVTLNWTSKDVSAMKYEVERKMPGETVFTKIADITPQAGTVLSNHTYQFTNTLQSITPGTFSYRVRQIIDTAAASLTALYINTASVMVTSDCIPPITEERITIQPNPVEGSITANLVVEINAAVSNMPIVIFDMYGNRVFQMKSSKATGRKTISLPVGTLQAGKYIIKVFDGQKPIGSAMLLKL